LRALLSRRIERHRASHTNSDRRLAERPTHAANRPTERRIERSRVTRTQRALAYSRLAWEAESTAARAHQSERASESAT
jgi:hypothetical protein